MEGTVKWFDSAKGFGFIHIGEGKNDIFVHKTAVQAAGLRDLGPDQKVRFDLEEKGDRISAINLQLVKE